MRERSSAHEQDEVSDIASGLKRRSSRNALNVLPVTASTTRPSTSVEKPYSHAVPGWCRSGALLSRATSSAPVSVREATPEEP